MAKEKVTITVDPKRLAEAKRLSGVASTSATIDLALSQLVRLERLRQDVAAYGATPPTPEEIAIGGLTPEWTDLADDTDWTALYEGTE